MKRKLTALLLCALLLTGILAGCGAARTEPGDEPAPEETAVPEPSADPGETPDYDALQQESYDRLARAWHAYEPDAVVFTVNGRPVTWGMFYYFISEAVGDMVYYTVTLPEDFSQPLSDGLTLGEYFINTAVEQNKYFAFAHEKLEELGAEFSPVVEEEIQTYWNSLLEQFGGEEGLAAALEASGLNEESFLYFLRSQGMLFQASDEIYGPGGEKLSDEEVLAWAEEKGYVRVKHILYYFYDDTGLPLDETGKEALRARAAAVSEELRALAESDPGAVEERFDELMYAETGDPGLAGYPDGYTFTRETSMYPEFIEAAFALEEYGVSEPVESGAGCHVLLRLPLDPDSLTMDRNADGETLTLRVLLAGELFDRLILDWLDSAEVVWTEEFAGLDLNELFAAGEGAEG